MDTPSKVLIRVLILCSILLGFTFPAVLWAQTDPALETELKPSGEYEGSNIDFVNTTTGKVAPGATAAPAQAQNSVPPTAGQADKTPQFTSPLTPATEGNPTSPAASIGPTAITTSPSGIPKTRLPKTRLPKTQLRPFINPLQDGDVYDNGPPNGEVDAWTINFEFVVSDTLYLASNDTCIDGVIFTVWLFPGDTLLSADVTISSDLYGFPDSYGGGSLVTAETDCFENGWGYNVCTETVPFTGNGITPPLASGTYYVNIQAAQTSCPPGGCNINYGNGSTDAAYWDENSGPSLAYENTVGSIPSESFTILGGTSACSAPPPDPGPCDECEAMAGAPINLTTGDVWVPKAEYSVPGLGGGLSLTRTWNSLWSLSSPPFLAGMFGAGWTSTFEERLQSFSQSQIEYWRASGNRWIFQQPNNCPTCTYTVATPPNQHATLAYNSTTGIYTLTFADGTTKTFNSQGYLTALADRNGNQTTITYDSSNRITNVMAAGGQALTFAYALAQTPNLVTSIQDSVGTVATYSYAGSTGVLLSQVVYADGSQLNYAYDSNENVVGVTDSQGVLETHTYDANGRGLTSARANGVDAVSVQYATGATTLTDSMGNMTTYSYTTIANSNFLTAIRGPGCDSCSGRNNYAYTLDSYGDRIGVTDPNGNTVSYTYDSSGNLLTRTDAVGTWTYTYNGFAEVLTAKDPLGNTTTNVYDGNGNLTSTTTPTGSTTQFTYNGSGELTRITDPLNNVTSLTYGVTRLVSGIRDAAGDPTSFSYDGRGNRTSVTDALADVTSFSYDIMNRLTLIRYADGSTTQFGYDIRGRRTSVTDANGNTTSYAYDGADRLVRVTDPALDVTTYAYDTENNLIGITDALGRTTGFQYDDLGRVTETLFPSSHVEGYGYDNNGNLIRKTDRNGQTVGYTYDAVNRLTQKAYSGNTVGYAYDADSRLTAVTDSTGTYQFTYDAMGRLTGSATNYSFLGRGFTTSYSYDAASNRISMSHPRGGQTTYAYDSLNRLTSLSNSWAGMFSLGYDSLSRRTSLTRPNGINTSYSYDGLSHLLSVLHQSGTNAFDGADYTYDPVGNRLSKTDVQTGYAFNYGYDNIYELLQVTQQGAVCIPRPHHTCGQQDPPPVVTENYTYDAVGNRLSSLLASYTYNSSNEIASASNASYTYDNNGNVLTETNSTGTTSYTWDAENRLTQVVLPGTGGTVTFNYDPFGRRIYKQSPTATSIFAYDGANLSEETNAAGTTVARYTQGLAIDEPLAMMSDGATNYYDADGLGTITSLTDTTGAITQTYTYDSFGNQTNSSGSFTNPFQYTAREFDTETNLYFYRARYYDPSVGRFLSEDPVRFNTRGLDFYVYVKNSPLGKVDPSGLATCDYYIQGSPDKNGWLYCTPDDPRNSPVSFPAASGNNGDPQHHCKNNPDCASQAGIGPIPPGRYVFSGDVGTHKHNGTLLVPDDPSKIYYRNGLLTHYCLNPFGASRIKPFCSEGCITASEDDINALNDLLTAEPNSTLTVYAELPLI